MEKARQRVESGRYSIFDVDEECECVCGVLGVAQKLIWESYNYEHYKKSQSRWSKKSREQKVCVSLKLSELRETQVMEMHCDDV